MSEYWKSTPKYWCKFCKTYVKDTKFEKQQHEATGRHKSNVQRSINQLHREHEREDREKQRAKDEVARLNAAVSGKPPPPKSTFTKPATSSTSTQEKKNDPEERKRQLDQLAGMGVSIPDEFRGDMAMAGEWQTVSVRRLEPDDDKKDVKPDVLNIGVHKRKLNKDEEDEDEDEEISSTTTKRAKQWGSRLQGTSHADDDKVDFDALMGNKKSDQDEAEPPERKETEQADHLSSDADGMLKKEEPPEAQATRDAEPSKSSPVVFKKRKKMTVT